MSVIKALSAGLLAVSVCIAQNVNISGTVTDTGDTAIEGAVVLLEKGGLVDTTGSDGSFTLTGTTDIKDQISQSTPPKLSATINNGFILINIAENSPVEIITYSLQGKVVSSIKKTLDVGDHSLKLPRLGTGVYMYQVQSGNEMLQIKSCSLSGGAFVSTHGTSSAGFTQQAIGHFPINDVIAVTKNDYLNYRVIVTNSDTSGIEIKMIVCAGTVTDIDGNVYQTVQIGDQVWTVENLRTTKYNDGSSIPRITDSLAWENDSSGAYCYYGNDSATNAEKYGVLYNWYVVDPTNPKKIAPVGWHVPTDSEWTILEKYLVLNGYNWDGTTDTATNNKIAKSLASKTDWVTITNPGAIGNDLTTNNRSGFSALPAGCRYSDGNFYNQGLFVGWRSATDFEAGLAWYRNLGCGGDSFYRYSYGKGAGFSVRLVRDLN